MTACKPIALSREELLKILRYDPDAGLLWWRERGSSRRFGKPIGSIDRRSRRMYLRFRLKHQTYSVHRIAFFMYHGYEPHEVDHWNGNSLDNRIGNLRPAAPSMNNANSRLSSSNTSGFKGASWDKHKRRWAASITKNYKHYFLGYFDTPEEAHQAYMTAAKNFFGEFSRAV